jgi:hypothetical protein
LIRQLNHQFLIIREHRQIILHDGEQLLVAQNRFSANGRIDVNSKRTTHARSRAHFRDLNKPQ